MKNKKKMPLKARKFLKVWVTAVLVIFVVGAMALTCFAAEDDPITVVNNLSDFMFGLVRAVGMIMLGFAVVQIGLSLKSHDPSQRANGFLTLAGGVVIPIGKESRTATITFPLLFRMTWSVSVRRAANSSMIW